MAMRSEQTVLTQIVPSRQRRLIIVYTMTFVNVPFYGLLSINGLIVMDCKFSFQMGDKSKCPLILLILLNLLVFVSITAYNIIIYRCFSEFPRFLHDLSGYLRKRTTCASSQSDQSYLSA